MNKTYIVFFVVFAVLLFHVSTLIAGENTVIVAGFNSGKVKDGAPVGWKLDNKKGTPDLELVKEDGKYALHLKSDSESSFGIKKDIELEKEEYPFLNWKWKVCKLPVGGDVRKYDTDDQAIQIYIAFRETGWPAKLKTPVIGYIWSNECPRETMVTSSQPFAGKVRYIVIRDKNDKLGCWYTEKRNIYEDFRKLFPDIDGGIPRDIKGVAFFINSQHTKSEAESYIYDVYFSKD
ncbi:MAG: DUF3047 domain-containing protein [Syntrophobacterales bacterium]|nr:DUF3047 domain-containing protein [Syntrophobacterales bacterium]